MVFGDSLSQPVGKPERLSLPFGRGLLDGYFTCGFPSSRAVADASLISGPFFLDCGRAQLFPSGS